MKYSKKTNGFYLPSIHGSDIPEDAVEINEIEYSELLLAQSQGKVISADANGNPVAVEPPPPTPEQIIASVTAKVQEHMDVKARERNYDGILSLCTYATSVVPKFAAEGQAGVEWRDAVWARCYEILADVQAGTRPTPTAEQLIAELPIFTWPA